jgi:hypothetical protein
VTPKTLIWSMRTRMLDHCMLDEANLVEFCDAQSDHAREMQKLERTLRRRRALKNIPVLGPAAKGIYRRMVRARRFSR